MIKWTLPGCQAPNYLQPHCNPPVSSVHRIFQNTGVGCQKVSIRIFLCIHRLNGEGDVTPLQDSCLENPMDGGAW